MGAFEADGPAGQVMNLLNDLGHDPYVEAMDRTEQKTHEALDRRGRIPVFSPTEYQAPIGLQQAEVGEPVQSTGRRKGLLVACNYPGQKGELRGCINDSKKWHGMLRKYGFPDEDILVLHDERGRRGEETSFRRRCVDGLRWLVDGARSGDVLFFTFSGHGSQVANHSGTEADGMDEVILPTDFKSAGFVKDD